MPGSTKFMMGSVVCCLAGLSLAAGVALSHQAGTCRIEVADRADWERGAEGVRGLRFVREHHSGSHQANTFPETVGYGRAVR